MYFLSTTSCIGTKNKPVHFSKEKKIVCIETAIERILIFSIELGTKLIPFF